MWWYTDLICKIYRPAKNKKFTKNWNWPFLLSQYWEPPISTLTINLWWSQIRGIMWRTEVYNLQARKKSLNRCNSNTKRSQIKIKLLDISEIKDSTHTIYWSTTWNVEMLEQWNWTFHMTLLKALKYTSCLSFWTCQKTIVEFTDQP